jgi:hypothetical protein
MMAVACPFFSMIEKLRQDLFCSHLQNPPHFAKFAFAGIFDQKRTWSQEDSLFFNKLILTTPAPMWYILAEKGSSYSNMLAINYERNR